MQDIVKRRDSGLGEEDEKKGCGGVKVEVSNHERLERNKKYAVYKVTVNVEGRSVTVSHRYSEFLTLCSKMKKRYPERHLKLPGKKIFGSVDAELVQIRCLAIQEFVEKLASDKSIINCPDVQAFLAVSPSRCNSYETDDEAYYSMNASVQSSRRNSFSEDLSLREKPNRMKPSDFDFLKVVGNGSFGKVFLAKHRADDKAYAVKVLNKHHVMLKNETRHVLCEREVLAKNSRHPFLVGLHYSFQTTDKLYLVMDYINGGELFFHLQREKRFSEGRVKFYGAEIASALGFLHSHNIIYRDLKPENILLDSEGHIALTDFGLCKEGKQMASTFCGTPEYLAPEVLQQKPYDRMVDWWCLGAVLYELLLGLPPFYSRNREEMFEMTMNKPLEFRFDIISDSARDLLTKMLAKDKSERLGFHSDLQEVKQHPFFKSIDWNLLDQRKVQPPFVPELNDGILDFNNFDHQFTILPVTESVTRTSKKLLTRTSGQLPACKMFENFSFSKPSKVETEDEIVCF